MRLSVKYLMGLACVMIFQVHTFAQQRGLSLKDAIKMAQEHSFEYKVAKSRFQSSTWRFRNYKASFLPKMNLEGTLPNYTQAINKITLPTGDDTFVSQNQAYSSLNLGVRQNLGLTGGVFSVASSLNRIDVFGDNKQVMYSSTPFSVSYYQDAIGYNAFKWQKKIEPLRYEAAERHFTTEMTVIAAKATSFYFNTLARQAQLDLARQNLANADTLYRIAKDRFPLGNVAESELLQLRLNSLNANKQVAQDSVDLVLERQQLARYLLIPNDVNLDFDERIDFFEVKFEDALQYAKTNSQSVLDFRLQRLDAEQRLEETKAKSGLKFNVQANFGVTNTAAKIGNLLHDMENQKQVSIGFSLPILDWGYAKTQRLQAEADLTNTISEIEQNNLQLEHEVALHTSRWNLHQQQMLVATESRAIAIKNYELEKNRYSRGTISINDLNIAQVQKDNTVNAYIHAIREYWELYYTIRRLTLYDFEKKEKIKYDLFF